MFLIFLTHLLKAWILHVVIQFELKGFLGISPQAYKILIFRIFVLAWILRNDIEAVDEAPAKKEGAANEENSSASEYVKGFIIQIWSSLCGLKQCGY